MIAGHGGSRSAPLDQWLGCGLAAGARKGSARDPGHAAGNGVSHGRQFADAPTADY